MDSMNSILTLALWDTNAKRAYSIKDRLDMFAPDNKEVTVFPVEIQPPLEEHDVVFVSFDKCTGGVLYAAQAFRQTSEAMFLILVCDNSSDFSSCFRPTIRPSGVLFHPVQNTQIRSVLEEVESEMQRLASKNAEDVFAFKSDGALRRIPVNDILFFEARNKKVSIRTAGQEIAYYDTIENLAAGGELPPYFMRCHRSYLVNLRKVAELHSATSTIKLVGGEQIPLSRSHQAAIREALS